MTPEIRDAATRILEEKSKLVRLMYENRYNKQQANQTGQKAE